GPVDLRPAGDAAPVVAQVMADRVRDHRRLFVDFLRHEVAVRSLLGRDRFERDMPDLALDAFARLVEDLGARPRHHRMVTLLQIGETVGEGREREGVGADVHLALAIADRERRAAAGDDDEIVLPLEEEGEREGPLEPAQRRPRRLERRQPRMEFARAEGGDGLGIGLGGEALAALLEFGAQRAVILDDAVVDDGNRADLMGMGVRFARGAMGRPAGVADAAPAADRLAHEQVRERDELAHRAPAVEPAVVDGGDPGAVIAAILEPLETLEDQRRRLVIAEDSHDATHQPALRRLISRSLSISRSPRPGFVVCRARASARAPAGTSSVTVEPAAT